MRKHVSAVPLRLSAAGQAEDSDNNPRDVKVLRHQDGSGGAVRLENNLKGNQWKSRALLDKESLKAFTDTR